MWGSASQGAGLFDLRLAGGHAQCFCPAGLAGSECPVWSFENSTYNQTGVDINVGGSLSARAGGNLVAQGVNANVGGSTSLRAGKDMQLTTALRGHVNTFDFYNKYKSAGDLLKISQRINSRDIDLKNSGNSWSSGGGVSLKAGGNLSVVGAQINSQGYSASAGGSYQERAAYDVKENVHIETTKRSGLGVYLADATNNTLAITTLGEQGGKTEKDRTETHIDSTRTAIVTDINAGAGAVNRNAGGDVLIEGSIVRGGEGLVDPVNAGGKVTAVAAVDTRHVEDSVFTSTIRWQSTKSTGRIEQTLHMPEIHGLPAHMSAYQGAGGVSVQLPAGSNVRTAIETLSQKPGQGYLKELGNRSDIDWQRVEELNKSLDFSKSGLTQEATIVAIIVVSILTSGAASSAGGAAATAVGASSTGAVATAFTAGFSSLASTAAVSLINNKGDIGATLKELGSEDNAKGLLLTMATAGLTQGVLSAIPVDGGTLAGVTAASRIELVFAKQVVQGITSAVMESAVMGTNLEDALKNNLKGALINTVAAKGAAAIGDAQLDATSKALAHALLGCAMGTATAGSSSGCAPGATGAVIGEIVAGLYADASGYDQLKIDANKPGASAELKQQLAVVTNTMTELAKLTGAGGALLIGGDASTMQTAMTTAQNAAQNNRQLHADERAWILNNADEFARSQGISRETAIARLSQQASRNVDLGYRARLSDGDDVAAQAFLGKPNATFTNDAGQAQTLFTTQGQQLLRPEMFADQVDVRFVQQYVAPGFTRSLEQGLNKELRDLGVAGAGAVKDGAINLAQAIKDQPGAVINAVWESVKGLPSAIWSGTQETGRAIGEGAAVSLDADLQQKLNALYQTDTRSAQMLLETARVVTALGAASGAARTADTFAEALNKGIAKKLDEIAAAKVEAQAQAAARVENNATRDAPGFGSSAVRDFKPGTTHRAENINAGQVTDRDGLPRIDEAEGINNQQVATNLGKDRPDWWGTQRPAWMEGTTVTDRVTTQPETYRMVIDGRAYENITNALDKGDIRTAAQSLGGWATKDPINSVSDVRSNLAISSEWKGRDGSQMYVVEFTVKPGVGVREGTVGPMFDKDVELQLPGGGHQVQFMQNTPRTAPTNFVINPSSLRPIK